MENTTFGEIIFIEVPHIRSVQRFVQKRVGSWVDDWKQLHGYSKERIRTFFYVRFEKVGNGHQIFCTVQLIIGNRLWKGTALASGLHRALIRSIEHLNLGFENGDFRRLLSDRQKREELEVAEAREIRPLRLVR
jgi:hypothetical protein